MHSAARIEVPLGANVLACPNHMKERFPMNCLKKSKTKTRDTEAEPVKARWLTRRLRSGLRGARPNQKNLPVPDKPNAGKPTVRGH